MGPLLFIWLETLGSRRCIFWHAIEGQILYPLRRHLNKVSVLWKIVYFFVCMFIFIPGNDHPILFTRYLFICSLMMLSHFALAYRDSFRNQITLSQTSLSYPERGFFRKKLVTIPYDKITDVQLDLGFRRRVKGLNINYILKKSDAEITIPKKMMEEKDFWDISNELLLFHSK